ncbi:MAG TPA: type II toxin-antitoxin system VapB family antitoxin [Rubrivivax sp.]|nr:type II toxin-antitoxin system VapB family antitoxin [Rubrivivax sp.]
MALQIANPEVVKKVAQLAKATGLSKTAAVELAVDRLMRESSLARSRNAQGLAALLLQFDQVPDRPDAFDPLEWDDRGLPR